MTTVTMAAPAGVTQFIGRDGTPYTVDASGNIAIPSNDVANALAAGFLSPTSGDIDGAAITDSIVGGASSLGENATDTIGFYGATPIAQPSGASQAAFTPSTLTSIGATVFSQAFTGIWGFSSSTVAKSYRTQINKIIVDLPKVSTLLLKIRANLVSLGLAKGGA